MYLLLSVSQTPDLEQASTSADLHFLSSMKLYQQSRAVNAFVQSFTTGYPDWLQHL